MEILILNSSFLIPHFFFVLFVPFVDVFLVTSAAESTRIPFHDRAPPARDRAPRCARRA